MKRLFQLAVLMGCCLALGIRDAAAQSSLTIPITMPIHGYWVFSTDLDLWLMDAYTGDIRLLDHAQEDLDHTLRDIRWDHRGERIVYYDFGDTVIINPLSATSEAPIVFQPNPRIDTLRPEDWSPEDMSILGVAGGRDEGFFSLETLNIADGSRTTLRQYTFEAPIPERPDVTFWNIEQADWNPTYTEWIAMLYGGFPVGTEGQPERFGTDLGIVFNYQTGEMVSVNELLGDQPFGTFHWSPNGKRLVTRTDIFEGQFQVLSFHSANGVWELETMTQSPALRSQYILDWLGVSDLFFMVQYEADSEDAIYSIGRIINEELLTTELFRLHKSYFPDTRSVGIGSWFLSANEAERQAISCLMDTSLPARLQAGLPGRVTITDGSGTRLRSEAGLDGERLMTMADGAAFNVLAGPMCSDGYRWWQVQLDDGTTGWSAEADDVSYFLEPV